MIWDFFQNGRFGKKAFFYKEGEGWTISDQPENCHFCTVLGQNDVNELCVNFGAIMAIFGPKC